MAKKLENPATKCTCNKCHKTVESAIPRKTHRACGGKKGAAAREPNQRLDKTERGTWEA